MNKEQTPIEEAEKWLYRQKIYSDTRTHHLLAQYAQEKVLEALEKDKLLTVSSEAMKGLLSGGKYYQNQSEKNDIAYHSVKIAKALIEEVTKQK